MADIFPELGAASSSSSRRKRPAKYRDPQNPEQTWGGIGRTPKWVQAICVDWRNGFSCGDHHTRRRRRPAPEKRAFSCHPNDGAALRGASSPAHGRTGAKANTARSHVLGSSLSKRSRNTAWSGQALESLTATVRVLLVEPAPGAIRQRNPEAPASSTTGLDQPAGRGCDSTTCSVISNRRCLNVVGRFRLPDSTPINGDDLAPERR